MEIEDFLKDLSEGAIVQNDPGLGRAYKMAIMSAVETLKAEIKKRDIRQAALRKERIEAVRADLLKGVIENMEERSGDYVDDQIFLEQQMAVIAEMRLVYLYKSYEVELKKILLTAYPGERSKFAKWEKLNGFIVSKGIFPDQIDGYSELDELREVVNSIKHAAELGKKVTAISEFRNSKQIVYHNGTLFYNRVEPMVNQYIARFSRSVFRSLYPL
jgi:hypothetical protein